MLYPVNLSRYMSNSALLAPPVVPVSISIGMLGVSILAVDLIMLNRFSPYLPTFSSRMMYLS